MDIALTVNISDANPIAHDIDFENGSPHLVHDGNAIAQHLRCRLKFVRGEWFLDPEVGVPYFQTIFRKGVSILLVRQVFREVILRTPGIAQLKRLDIPAPGNQRLLKVSFEAITDSGEVISVGFGDPFVVDL